MKYIFFFVTLFYFNETYCQLGKVYPKNESKNDSSLIHFISELKLATQKRDKVFIEQSLATKTYIPLEGVEISNKEKFLDYYFDAQYTGSILWDNLDYIFKIGGGGFSDSKDEYYLPYTSANLSVNDMFSSLGLVVALSDSVPVFDAPHDNADIINHLSFDVVEVTYEGYHKDYLEVILNLSDTVYVKPRDVIPTVSIRAGLIKEEGKWKLQYADAFD
ncbi:hypothetical protein [Flammeovirga pacifica]|uniref:Uncharacterized protein n=1 Tax=Flammeovirga pacifica TaxID=915059 RepID=A0A1S1YU65_FLAPC|nr:hypothetical protein [Flammeovirga pacifica]OHX64558.1 hypothetical protein NH26_23585 [Flammeovirga pacifica]